MGKKEYQEKLGIHDLEESRRESLYDGFKKVGGQLVELPDDEQAKFRKRMMAVQDGEQRERAEAALLEQKSNYFTDPSLADMENDAKRPTGTAPKKQLVSRVDLFMARWNGIWAGLFPFFGKRFARSFTKDLMEFLFERMLSAKQILVSIFHQSKELSDMIYNGLEIQKGEQYYELLYRYDSMFDEKLFREIESALDGSNPLDLAKTPLMAVYKKLFILKPNQQLLKKSAAILIKMEGVIKKMNPAVAEKNTRIVNDSIDFAMNRLYPRYDMLAKYYHLRERFDGRDLSFKAFLQIQAEDLPGALTKAWKDQREQEKKQEALRQAEAEKNKPEEPTDDIMYNIWNHPDLNENQRKGLEIIYQNVSFQRTLAFFKDSKDARALFEINDKVFVFYTLVDFFDKEFSFLFSSGIVEYNVFLDKLGRKMDLKNSLKDIHFKFNDIYRRIKEYLQLLIEMHKKHESGVKPDSPEMQHYQHQRETIFQSIDFDARKIVPDLLKLFQYAIEDYQKTKKVLLNPETEIEFDPRTTKGRMCNKRKVITAFLLGMQYLAGLDFLMTNGDLTPHSVDIVRPVFVNVKQAPKPASPEPAKPEAAAPGNSPEKSDPIEGPPAEGMDIDDLLG